MTLADHIRLAGILQFILVLLNFDLPRRFHWKQDFSQLTLLNRQIFYVHASFIVLILLLFGGISVFYAPLLTTPTPLAAPLLFGLALFWTLRFVFQLFVYSPKIWCGNRFFTAMHILFTCLWLYLAGVYAIGFVRQL